MKVHIKTYGCTANQADSRSLASRIIQLGHTLCDEVCADVVVVNTCTVTGYTERRVLSDIKRLQKEGREVVVAGCLPAAQPEHMQQLRISKIITPKRLENINQLLPKNPSFKTSDLVGEISSNNTALGAVSIATGCVGNCSYCIVKKARGELKSKPPSEIKQEVSELVSKGVWEIQLTAQDTACYGWDIDYSLPELLEELSRLPGDFRIRVGMMNPATAITSTDELLEAYQSEKVYKFLHLPVQSGSDKILADMNRGHTIADYKHIISGFSAKYPEGIVSTDFIVGYPTETEEDFEQTLALLKETRAFKVNITRYSPRPHTVGASLTDLPQWIKKERSRRLTKEHLRISEEILQRYLGETCEVTVIEQGKNNTSIARDDNYRYIVIKEQLPLGSRHRVRITDTKTTYLIARRANNH
jgi:MiaB-like tRNA modifying enzyme